MRTRLMSTVVIALVAGLAAQAQAAVNYLNQITGGNASGMYLSSASAGSACMDDFEIFGTQGNGPMVTAQIVAVEAVFRGVIPPAFQVNVYNNTGDPAFTNLRTLQQGNAFSQIFDFNMSEVQIQAFPVPGESGNFPNSFLLTISLNNVHLDLGEYYLSIVAVGLDASAPFFIVGSDTVTDGTPNNLVQVLNQGPAGIANVIPDNAAYRVIGVPTPGAVGLLGLAGIAAMRRRRR